MIPTDRLKGKLGPKDADYWLPDIAGSANIIERYSTVPLDLRLHYMASRGAALAHGVGSADFATAQKLLKRVHDAL